MLKNVFYTKPKSMPAKGILFLPGHPVSFIKGNKNRVCGPLAEDKAKEVVTELTGKGCTDIRTEDAR